MLTHSGKWTIDNLNQIIHKASIIKDIGKQIDFLSKQFLDTEYRESTLIGDINTPEIFIINLEWMDCLTFIEYIEAMRLSGSYSNFIENLKMVRYCQGKVSFENRRHFFTDWAAFTPKTVDDVTAIIGGPKTVKVRKKLNLKSNGTYIIPGIGYKEREISYIPVSEVDELVLQRLKTGDYAGIYNPPLPVAMLRSNGSPAPLEKGDLPPFSKGGMGGLWGKGGFEQRFSGKDGLDVSHVGIIIKNKDAVYLRHASSRRAIRKVIDENFNGYITGKKGMIILRPLQFRHWTSDS
ncbi:MAG: DUF1460 domain-containing protein [Nitrospirae bacterium]|nr:DUF1460 domain-containing protein [Nitrospirota bacterium]